MRFSSERERVVGHSLGLDKESRAHTRLSNEGGRLHLEAKGLGWSVGRDRRERESHPQVSMKVMRKLSMKRECKTESKFTLETLFLYKKGAPKLEPHSNLFF